MFINHSVRQTLLVSALSMLTAVPAFAATNTDPVILTFSTLGDSRQDAASPDGSVVIPSMVGVGTCPITTSPGFTSNPGLTGQDCKWLQNTKAISRLMRSIQSQKPNLLFFNGDMILGYGLAGLPVTRSTSNKQNPPADTPISNIQVSDIVGSDLMQMYQQYGFWRGMVAPLMETGTYVVPVPGNHETECKRCNKTAQQPNEAAWVDNMKDLILDTYRLNLLLNEAGNGLSLNTNPTTGWNPANAPGAADGLTTSQEYLSYSFDIGTSHFAVINTDPVGKDGHAPSVWLDNDLKTAIGNGAQNLFVFGHKPAYYFRYTGYSQGSANSLFDTDPGPANAFWNVIMKYNATYFCGHEHIYNVSQPMPTTLSNGSPAYSPTGGTAYQVIVGTGGSPFDDSGATGTDKIVIGNNTIDADRVYAWATVSIHASGKATISTYGFQAQLPTNPTDPMTAPIVNLQNFTLPAAAINP